VSGDVVPRLRDGNDTTGAAARWRSATSTCSYGEEDIPLLPDWERVKDLVLVSGGRTAGVELAAAADPLGYPATLSLGAGAVRHVDMGHLAPVGPMFQGTWNRLAAAAGRRRSHRA
jgi:hypothetical protein